MTRVHVVGAGLTGLASAWRLSHAGFDVRVSEASDRAGGLIGTTQTSLGLVERGANAFVWTEAVERWFRELDIEPVFPTPESRKRYVFRDGRARRWPLNVGETVAAGTRGIWAWMNGRLAPGDTENVGDWSRRVVGAAASNWIIAPALQGTYAAPADRLAARAIFGPHRRPGGRRRRRQSVAPRAGMGEFIDVLVARLQARHVPLRFGQRVDALDPEEVSVIATDATSAATLIAPDAPAVSQALLAIDTTRLLSTTAFFAPHPSDVRGFGVLFPRQSGVEALGVLFNTSIFPGRGVGRSETWIYGAFGSPSGLPADVAAAISRDREALTGRRTEPEALLSGWTDDTNGAELPIYGPSVLDAMKAVTALPRRISLAGNYLGRLGVGKLLEQADELAAAITAPLRASASR